jgi:hypothetical protein
MKKLKRKAKSKAMLHLSIADFRAVELCFIILLVGFIYCLEFVGGLLRRASAPRNDGEKKVSSQ